MNNTLPIGTILKEPNGRAYRVEQVLGQGGFGITYKVSSSVMVGNVPTIAYFAVKEHFLKDACERSESNSFVVCSNPLKPRVEQSRADFFSEAKRLKSISGKNPGVVPVNEVFEDNNTVYYVMEYLNGGDLREWIKAKGSLPEEEALALFLPVANAVAFLHENKINHLDIKPDNVMFRVDYSGSNRTPVIIDFGLAKHFDEKGKPTSEIRVQGCSDGFAPVEQYAGLKEFSPQADVYALGAVLYFMLTGRVPEVSSDITEQKINAALPEGLSTNVRKAIIHAMAYRTDERTKSVNDMISEITSVQPSQAEAESAPEPPEFVPGEHTKVISQNKADNMVNDNIDSIDDKKPKSNSWIYFVISGVAAAILAICGWLAYDAGWFDFSSKSTDDVEQYQDDYDNYTKKCDNCKSLIEQGNDTNYEALINAKNVLMEIKNIESDFEDVNTGDLAFDRYKDLDNMLNPKLISAQQAWVDAAKAQELAEERTTAYEYYKIAFDLKPSEEIGAKMRELESYVK